MIYPLSDATLGEPQKPSNTWKRDEPIVIDYGSFQARVGMASQANPRHLFQTRAARVKRGGETLTIVGDENLVDSGVWQQSKSPFEGSVVTNWDVVEDTLDYAFSLLGVNSENCVDNPLAFTEPFAAPILPRRTLSELLFETYGIQKLCLGVDALCAFHRQGRPKGLIVDLGHEAAHVCPYPDVRQVQRVNWGGRQAAELMHQLLVLKYPLFPTRVSSLQAADMVRKFGYVAQDYDREILNSLNNDAVLIEAPPIHAPKTADELAKQAQRRKESSKRLQEQAAKAREARQKAQEEEILELTRAADNEESATYAGFADVDEAKRALRRATNALKRSKGEEIDDPEPPTDLVEIPDTELTPEQSKAKKRQRLLKAGWDARQRQKREKEETRAKEAEIKRREEEWRDRDLSGWAATKRQELGEIMAVLKQRARLRNEAKGRQGRKRLSLVLEEDGNTDTEDEGALVDLEEQAHALRMQLIEFDPSFDPDEFEEKPDWRTSVLHRFLYGPRPLDLDPESAMHRQMALNVERCRVVEPFFQPAVASLDQAGIGEVASAAIMRGNLELAQNVIVTGGMSNIPGVIERLHAEIQSNLPAGTPISVTKAADPTLDPWRGLANLAANDQVEWLTRREYEETGDVYRRWNFGNWL